MVPRVPTSVLLSDLMVDGDADAMTAFGLIARLGDRSFGLILTVLGLLATLPGVSAVAGFAIVILAAQMAVGRSGPLLPRRLGNRKLGRAGLAKLIRWSGPVLRLVERIARPRWPAPVRAARRPVGGVIMVLGGLLFAPIPFSNVPPALAIVLIAVAYVEEDGLLLGAALLGGLFLLIGAAGTLWEGMSRLGWVGGIL